MKRLIGILAVGWLFAAPLAAQAKLNVFACEPEWAALAEAIGGGRVKAFAATSARQNPHYIRARPSLIAKARAADLLVCSGGGLEIGWLPILLRKAGKGVQPGAAGHLMVSDIVPMLDKPAAVDRSMGDVHPEGNPHVHLNPHNIAIAAAELNRRLQLVDPAHLEDYQSNYEAFVTRWQAATERWEREAIGLKGARVVVYHKSFTYLLDWLGMVEAASLEPKPGIPPTVSHLEALLVQLRVNPAKVIIRTPYDPDDASLWLSEKSAIPVVVLPYTVGGSPQADNLFSLFDRTVAQLAEAIR